MDMRGGKNAFFNAFIDLLCEKDYRLQKETVIVRRGKTQKPPSITRTSARLSGTRRSPRPALRSRVANLKRPDKYEPKSALNLTQLGSKPPRVNTRTASPSHTESPGPELLLSDSDDDVLLLNDFDGEENDESIEAIKEAIDQMGVAQPGNEFEMVAQSGSEYAYLLAGSEEEKKRAEALIQKVHINIQFLDLNLVLLPSYLFFYCSAN